MKKSVLIISIIVMLFTACSTQREVEDKTYDSGWIRYQCGIFQPSFEQHPSRAVASILKKVDSVYYCSEDVKTGKYEIALEKITDNFFKVKDKELYLELRGEVSLRDEYHGVLEVKPVKRQHPWKENRLYNTTAEFFHLAPYSSQE